MRRDTRDVAVTQEDTQVGGSRGVSWGLGESRGEGGVGLTGHTRPRCHHLWASNANITLGTCFIDAHSLIRWGGTEVHWLGLGSFHGWVPSETRGGHEKGVGHQRPILT